MKWNMQKFQGGAEKGAKHQSRGCYMQKKECIASYGCVLLSTIVHDPAPNIVASHTINNHREHRRANGSDWHAFGSGPLPLPTAAMRTTFTAEMPQCPQHWPTTGVQNKCNSINAERRCMTDLRLSFYFGNNSILLDKTKYVFWHNCRHALQLTRVVFARLAKPNSLKIN